MAIFLTDKSKNNMKLQLKSKCFPEYQQNKSSTKSFLRRGYFLAQIS